MRIGFGAPLAWPQLVAGFVLFRLFDIIKPGPVGWLDHHLRGGLGIMADDIAAGALAWLILNLIFQYLARIGGLLP
jgi:phosphatidylglycerophosphatase A